VGAHGQGGRAEIARGHLKKLLWLAVALVAAAGILVGFTAPPKPLPLAPFADGTIAGIAHVHTNRSDGLSDPDTIASAAARAGLKFLVFTDHGDGMRKPDPPQYRAGVLCLDGAEISTSGGHYVALDMPAAPFPLAGEPRDVVEDVRRLGGFGIAAHPDSPKLELAWRDWSAPFDGLELLNPDTAWRLWTVQANVPGEQWGARRRLALALLDYPFRPAEVMASLIQPSRAVEQWTTLLRRRRVVAIAGVDAHAKLAPRSADPGDSRFALPFPAYEPSFRVFSIHARTERPLSGDAAVDSPMLMRAIRAGHLFTAVDAVAAPPSFEFTATNDRATVHEGDELGAGGPITLRVHSNAPAAFTTTVWMNGMPISGDHHEADFTVGTTGEPAVYWVEIRATGQKNPLTWVRSNPIYVRGPEPPSRPPARPAPTQSAAIFDGKSEAGWRVEHDPTSLAAVDPAPIVGGTELRFRFGLAGGTPGGQVAALVYDTPKGVAPNDRIAFSIRAERPMRVSVQLRAPDGARRWERTVYIDPTTREYTLPFDDFRPIRPLAESNPDLATVGSVLFVVDANHTRPGASGRIWLKQAALEH